MKRLLFPFSPLFDRLMLKQRWWHRLAVVIFFLAFIIAAALVGAITWEHLPLSLSHDERRQILSSSFPQLEPPEDSTAGVDFDFVETAPAQTAPAQSKEPSTSDTQSKVDWSKYPAHEALDCYDVQGQLLVDLFAAFDGVITQCAPGETSKPKSERIHVPPQRLQYVEQAESCQKQVTAQYAKGDAGVYRKKMDECLDPKRYATEGPAELQQFPAVTPIKTVLKHDMETNPKGTRVDVPKVGVVAFPVGMKESDVTHRCQLLYDRIAAAEHRAKAITILYAMATLITLFYLPQVVYRLLLYVVFGGHQ